MSKLSIKNDNQMSDTSETNIGRDTSETNIGRDTSETNIGRDTSEGALAEKLRLKRESEERGEREADKLHNASPEVRDQLEDKIRGNLDSDPIAKAAFDARRKEQKENE